MKGRLTLNTDLLSLPEALTEYVIVHELVHLVVPNHGKSTHAALLGLYFFNVPIFYTDIAPLGLIFCGTHFYTDVAPLGLKVGNTQISLTIRAIRIIRENPRFRRIRVISSQPEKCDNPANPKIL